LVGRIGSVEGRVRSLVVDPRTRRWLVPAVLVLLVALVLLGSVLR
jgi:hypothetical protein